MIPIKPPIDSDSPRAEYFSKVGNERLALRCPVCLKAGTLDAGGDDQRITDKFAVGHRRCPDPTCQTYIAVIYQLGSGDLLASYPAERLDFDATSLPITVQAALEEAVTCHAHQAYTAAGMVLRKAMEAMCDDVGSDGETLYDRIEGLKDHAKIVLPEELLEGLHHLRLLGNDAAHIRSKTFDNVGRDEVETAVPVVKLVLQAVYQTSAAVEALKKLAKKASLEAAS